MNRYILATIEMLEENKNFNGFLFSSILIELINFSYVHVIIYIYIFCKIIYIFQGQHIIIYLELYMNVSNARASAPVRCILGLVGLKSTRNMENSLYVTFS